MRSSRKTFVAVVVSLVLAPQLAAADEVQEQLDQMQGRLTELESRLQATTDQLEVSEQRVEEQQTLIERAGLHERSAQSSLSRFLSMTEFSGLVAASWSWNFEDPSDSATGFNSTTTSGENGGIFGLTAPYHQNHNSFQLDQLWFGMHKPATVESRGGFGADVVFGVSADGLRGSSVSADNTGDLPHIYQAYASYLAPVGENGVLVKAGRYETIIGAELFRQDQNYNVTRGLVWSMQPVNHTGVLMSTELGGGLSAAAGIANDQGNTQVDRDNSKTALAQVKYATDMASLAVNGAIGGDINFAPFGSETGIGSTSATSGIGRDSDVLWYLDVVATADPSDNLGMWFNFDWISANEDHIQDWDIYAFAAASRLAISERTGVSIRGEYIFADNVIGACRAGAGCPAPTLGTTGAGQDLDLWEITATIDHALTDHLTVRAEGRYDRANVDGGSETIFIEDNDPAPGTMEAFTKRDQWLALVEMLYTF